MYSRHIFHRQRLRLSVALLLTTLFSSHAIQAARVEFASGEKRVHLIELFTSQGCSSCPPAERWLGQLKGKRNLWSEFVPVAFHVDYWDYLGWKDTLASSRYSKRQRNYHQQGSIRTVYTPGFLLNGEEWRTWLGREVPAKGTDLTGQLKVVVADGQIQASYLAAGAARKEDASLLNIALLAVDIDQQVAAGENAGRDLDQDFSVLRFVQLQSDQGKWSVDLPKVAEAKGRLALAAWVSGRESQRPLQATGGWIE